MGDVVPAERDALVALFEALDGDSWEGRWGNSGWGTLLPCSQWSGVRVVDGHVTELYLNDNGINGELPSDVFCQLKSLIFLDLSGNSMYGPIPEDLAECSKLQQLYIAGNDFDQPVPVLAPSLRLYDFELNEDSVGGGGGGRGGDDDDGVEVDTEFFENCDDDWDGEDEDGDDDEDDEDLDFGGQINHIDWD